MSEKGDYDISLLTALYYGNHLDSYELERDLKVLTSLHLELETRVK